MLQNNRRNYMLKSMNLIGQEAYYHLKNKDKIKTNVHLKNQSYLNALHNKDGPCAYPVPSQFSGGGGGGEKSGDRLLRQCFGFSSWEADLDLRRLFSLK